MVEIPKISFAATLFIFQVILLGLYTKYVYYVEDPTGHNLFYPQFTDVHTMIFIGFGFLMTFLKRYGFGALSWNMLLSAVTIQWAMLMNAWFRQRIMHSEGHYKGDPMRVELNVNSLIGADFAAGAVAISYGAVLGKASRLQLLVMAIFETIVFAINETILMEYLHISDVGGSVVIHLFGAYFGLAVASVLRNSGDDHPNEGSVYNSDIFAMIGTLFLWTFWPSFNAAPVGDKPFQQNRAVVNTYISLAACVATSFALSSVVHKKYKLDMVHIQNATMAGGVAVGSCADLMIRPWGAMLIGMIAGMISVLGYAFITPFMSKKLKIHDTCGVHNLHGMPAVFAGVAASIAAATINVDKYPAGDIANLYPKVASGDRSNGKQGGYMAAAVAVALSTSILGGLITGFVIRLLDSPEDDMLYNDEHEFEVPDDTIALSSSKEKLNGHHESYNVNHTNA